MIFDTKEFELDEAKTPQLIGYHATTYINAVEIAKHGVIHANPKNSRWNHDRGQGISSLKDSVYIELDPAKAILWYGGEYRSGLVIIQFTEKTTLSDPQYDIKGFVFNFIQKHSNDFKSIKDLMNQNINGENVVKKGEEAVFVLQKWCDEKTPEFTREFHNYLAKDNPQVPIKTQEFSKLLLFSIITSRFNNFNANLNSTDKIKTLDAYHSLLDGISQSYKGFKRDGSTAIRIPHDVGTTGRNRIIGVITSGYLGSGYREKGHAKSEDDLKNDVMDSLFDVIYGDPKEIREKTGLKAFGDNKDRLNYYYDKSRKEKEEKLKMQKIAQNQRAKERRAAKKVSGAVPIGEEETDFQPYNDNEKYHQKVPEVKFINPKPVKRRDSFEVSKVSDEIANSMDFSEPIEVSIFRDGELICQNGHHRLAAAKQLGMDKISVDLTAINAYGKNINALLQYQNQFIDETLESDTQYEPHQASDRKDLYNKMYESYGIESDKSGFTEDETELATQSDIKKVQKILNDENLPATATEGKAYVVKWADGRGIFACKTKKYLSQWLKDTGAWAEIVSIEYTEPKHGTNSLKVVNEETYEYSTNLVNLSSIRKELNNIFSEGLIKVPTEYIRSWFDAHYNEFISKLKETKETGFSNYIEDLLLITDPYNNEKIEIPIEIIPTIFRDTESDRDIFAQANPNGQSIDFSAKTISKYITSKNLKDFLIGTLVHEVAHLIDPGKHKKNRTDGNYEDSLNSDREVSANSIEYIDRISHLSEPKKKLIVDRIRKGSKIGIPEIDSYMSDLTPHNKMKFIKQLIKAILI